MTLPDWMPVLGAGPHDHPRDGACVMEYISFIKGEEWSDTPACTAHAVGTIAVQVNDKMANDETRSLLLVPLIGKIMACAPQGPDETEAFMHLFADQRGAPTTMTLLTLTLNGEPVELQLRGNQRINWLLGTAIVAVDPMGKHPYVPNPKADEVGVRFLESLCDEWLSYFNLSEEHLDESEQKAHVIRLLAEYV